MTTHGASKWLIDVHKNHIQGKAYDPFLERSLSRNPLIVLYMTSLKAIVMQDKWATINGFKK